MQKPKFFTILPDYIATPDGMTNAANFNLRTNFKAADPGNNVVKTTVVANGTEHTNGMRIRGNHVYVTQSMLSKIKYGRKILKS